ncbi:hypothetical protein E8E11_003546 [Didymella keratinophila]|nr:hypothetical protein E8E11_003546 [Didymella keratinophila]
MDSSPSKLAQQLPAAGTPKSSLSGSSHSQKPSLLPAFGEDNFSSSPFPRPGSSKRKFEEDSPSFAKQLNYYPTPVPTSSTGILNFSSPRHARPVLQRAVSALTERAPLGAVPTVDLPANGELLRMGRSSNSADYQLSTNRLISRVHVQAAYHAPDSTYPRGHIDVECLGWNGAKIHCGGAVFELAKGDTYVSENPESEIMLDVQDTRVVIAWPVIPVSSKFSWESEEEDMPTPTRRNTQGAFDSSPPVVPRSPVSQSPMHQPVFEALGPNAPTGGVQVFEDADAQDEGSTLLDPEKTFIRPTVSPIGSSQEAAPKDMDPKASFTSSFGADDYSDNDEENDPVVHSFGPFGQNLVSGLESFSTATPGLGNTPRPPRKPLSSPSKRSSVEAVRFKESPIKNHVINQLAYSRVHSHPLSTIHSNLPAELKACASKPKSEDAGERSGSTTPLPELSQSELRKILERTSCVGEIPRIGKDAAGKPLESEYYYVPEMDPDQMRRETITAGMRSTGLRSVRKTHKQYYWKKPRV